MNNLPVILQHIFEKHGADILSDMALLKTALKIDAPQLDRVEKAALFSLCKNSVIRELKDANEKERPYTKAYLAQQLHDETTLELPACNEIFGAIEAALFGASADMSENMQKEALLPAIEMSSGNQSAKTRKAKKARTTILLYILIIIVTVALCFTIKAVINKVNNPKNVTVETPGGAGVPPDSGSGTGETKNPATGKPAKTDAKNADKNSDKQQSGDKSQSDDNSDDKDNAKEPPQKGGSVQPDDKKAADLNPDKKPTAQKSGDEPKNPENSDNKENNANKGGNE